MEPDGAPEQLNATDAGENPHDVITGDADAAPDAGNVSPDTDTESNEADRDEGSDVDSHDEDDAFVWDTNKLWSVIMLSGTRRLTRQLYDSIRRLASRISVRVSSAARSAGGAALSSTDLKKIFSIPDYKTIRKVYRRVVYRRLAVRTKTARNLPINWRAAGVADSHVTLSGTFSGSVRYVPPSQYARADLACPEVFEAMRSGSLKGHRDAAGDSSYEPPPSSLCLDSLPLVRARPWFYCPTSHVSVDECLVSTSLAAEVKDRIKVRLVGSGCLLPDIVSFFGEQLSTSQSAISLQGEISHVIAIRCARTATGPALESISPGFDGLSDRDGCIARAIEFSAYSSPADVSGNIRHREDAWRRWVKPAFKPGDIAVILKPCSANDVEGAPPEALDHRLCLVYRFWTERSERDRHVCFIRAGSTCPAPSLFAGPRPGQINVSTAEVTRVIRTLAASSSKGPSRFPMVSSMGMLDNGEEYFIYRFFIFWDGFTVHRGAEGSADGMYLLPMNIPLHRRSTPNAIRVLAFAPPGVKSDSILPLLVADIVEGATNGFVDFDANGQRRRIFLDLLGFIGDTPAINGCLDVLGHSSHAPCHQCRYYRTATTNLGSTATGVTCIGTNTASRRSVSRHNEIRAAGAGVRSCSLLGVTHSPSPTHLVLHRLAQCLSGSTLPSPKDSFGNTILCSVIDPFRSCVVAPDHALFNHVKDILELSFRFLPDKHSRKCAESFVLQNLHDANLKGQNRVWSFDNSKLFKMTMSQVFALIQVAPYALRSAIVFLRVTHSTTIRPSCDAAVELLFSIRSFMAKLFWVPDANLDDTARMNEFNHSSNETYREIIRVEFDDHLRKVRQLCAVSHSQQMDLRRSARGSQERRALQTVCDDAELACKCLDKANLHRIRELCHGTLDMVGCVSLINELVLEKRHRILKRAVSDSNYKDIQHHAMNAAVFNDWQARLTHCLPLSTPPSASSLLSAYRLLSGPHSVRKYSGSIPSQFRRPFEESLRDSDILAAELTAQGLSVISPDAAPSFLADSPFKAPANAQSVSVPDVTLLTSLFSSRFSSAFDRLEIIKCLYRTNRTSNIRLPISANTILRTLSIPQNSPTSPFLSLTGEDTDNASRTAHLWCVKDIIRSFTVTASTNYFARVFPVRPVHDSLPDAAHVVNMMHTPQILPLTSTIQVCAALHDCGGALCQPNLASHKITHTAASSPLQGGSFFVLSRDNGFPPRCG